MNSICKTKISCKVIEIMEGGECLQVKPSIIYWKV